MSSDGVGSSQRRAFFREAVARVVGPLANYMEQHVALPVGRQWLRPPGAIEESRLLTICYRCGACVEACPAKAIFPLDGSNGDAAGTPVIDADAAACVVCDGLKCTKTCPSGALLPIEDPHNIRMGLAEVYGPNCARSRKEPCTLCVDLCPLGETAIRFNDEGPPEVLSPGCIGCGVCQLHCPTSPTTIIIHPS